MDKLNMSNIPLAATLKWLMSRVWIIYLIILVFCFTCMDLKTIEMRIKVRHLNDAIPDFSDMILFSKGQKLKHNIDWNPYRRYFGIILRYMPDDALTRQLLAFVDYHTGREREAVGLYKSSALINGQALFWSNYNLGVIYYKRGMWPQAGEYLLKAIESNPQLTILLMKNSIIYRQISVSPYFKYSLGEDISEAQGQAYLLLLSSLYQMGQYDKVFVVFKLAIANPNLTYQDAYYYYGGLALVGMGQINNAFLLFQKSLAIEKNNPEIYYYISNIYQKAGQLEQARSFLQASYALHQKKDPRFPYEEKVTLHFF